MNNQSIDYLGYAIYAVIVVVWCIVGLYAAWYVNAGVRRSEETLAALQQTKDRDLETLIAKRRLQRERMLMFVEYAILAAGMVAAGLLFVPIDDMTLRPLLRPIIPALLIIGHILLGVHSYQIHIHHHELMNKLTAEILRKQLSQKTRHNVKDIAMTEIDNKTIAVAVVDHEGEDLHGPEHTTTRINVG